MGDRAVQEAVQVKGEGGVAVGDRRYRSMNQRMELEKDYGKRGL